MPVPLSSLQSSVKKAAKIKLTKLIIGDYSTCLTNFKSCRQVCAAAAAHQTQPLTQQFQINFKALTVWLKHKSAYQKVWFIRSKQCLVEKIVRQSAGNSLQILSVCQAALLLFFFLAVHHRHSPLL